uniref:Uncharacterized protein n=1 Tax=viral metagenome TaxID=1070528 RepID=A0A6C0CMB1_9ZZZZ
MALIFHDLSDLNKNFNGAKTFHAFKTKPFEKEVSWMTKGKNPKKITKTVTSMHYIPEFASPEAEETVKYGTFFWKHDGSCSLARLDDNNRLELLKRYDIKPDKKTGEFRDAEDDWIICGNHPKPEAGGPVTHWPVFRPIDRKGDKHHLAAEKLAQQYIDSHPDASSLPRQFTCEIMGTKFNYKPCDPMDDHPGVLVPHNLVEVDIHSDERTYWGILSVLQTYPTCEGLVVYPANPDLPPLKIRRDVYPGLEWPAKDVEPWQTSIKVAMIPYVTTGELAWNDLPTGDKVDGAV